MLFAIGDAFKALPQPPRRSIMLMFAAAEEQGLIGSQYFAEHPPIPGLFVPLRIVEAYRALAMARGVRIPPEYELAAAMGRRIELACLADPIELRPCHNDLLNANFIDDGSRIRIVDWEYAGMGDPYFDLGNFSINHELTPDDDANLLGQYLVECLVDQLQRSAHGEGRAVGF